MASSGATCDKYNVKKLSRLTKDTTEEEMKDLYKNWATTYEKDVLQQAQIIFRKPLAECLDVAIKEVFPDKTKSQIKIIDAGAGTGLAGVELFTLGYTNMDALDISQEMLNEAKKKNIYKKLICAPITEQRISEIETGEYHAMISTGTLATAHVQPEAVKEMIRMVKPGGLVCFSMRPSGVEEYEEKILELERAGKWKTFSKETLPYSEKEDLPKEINAFIFKVL